MKDVIIIGGGPSGMTCALNLLRAGHSVLIIEKEAFGGQIATSPRVENIPSIKEISGLEFSDQLFEQISVHGVEFELEEVLEVVKNPDDTFTVKTNYGEHMSKAVVIANGVSHRKMGLPKEEDFVGKGISFCAVCDGAFYKGKDVYLIGDANTALQYALMLSKTSSHVYMITLFDKFFGDKILVDRLLATPNISVIHNMNLIEYLGEDELSGLKFENTKTHEIVEYKTDNVFVAIGQIPHNEFLSGLVEQEKGFIVTNEKMETNVPGIFAIGDTRVKVVRQVSTAVGDASTASFFVDRYLQSK
ncbi:MAG: NAD(P)/FAD-dependent oxidoreductase [Bacilli bacterium]|nr:NAD(P)/FAD-dependent oxidoreductase [Bacilli bacterium]